MSKNGLFTHFPRRTSTNLEIFFSAYWNAAGAMILTQLFQQQYDIMDETWRGIVGQVVETFGAAFQVPLAIDFIDAQYDVWQVSVKRIFSIKRRAARRTCSFCGKEVPTSEPALSVCECLAVPAAAPKSPVTDDPPPRNVRVVAAAAPRPRVSTECPRRSRGGAAAPCLYGMSTS